LTSAIAGRYPPPDRVSPPRVVFGLQLLLTGAAAPDPRVFLVDSDRALAPDGVVSIGWKNLPAGVEECELLLDTDRGRARARITDELASRIGSRGRVVGRRGDG